MPARLINMKFQNIIDSLKKNNMNGFYAKDKSDALEIVKSLIKEGDTVTHGGSETLKQCGIIEYVKNNKFNYLDRSKPDLTPADIDKLYRDSFFADVYLTSSNAVTENGFLYNVDGNSNRVAAMIFGPKKVIVVVGKNKIVKNIDEAIKRVKTKAAPPNCVRLNKNTYCAIKGECVSLNSENSYLCDGCDSNDRICRNYVVMGPQTPATKGRVNVIIIDEELGY